MKIDIKKHLTYQAIMILFGLLLSFTAKEKDLYDTVLVLATLLAMFNAFYIPYKIINQIYRFNMITIVLFGIVYFLNLMIFMIVSLPIMIGEVVLLITGRDYIERKVAKKTVKMPDPFPIDTNYKEPVELKMEYKEIEGFQTIITVFVFMAVFFLPIMFLSNGASDTIVYGSVVILLVTGVIIVDRMNAKLNEKRNALFYPVLLQNCDSETFCLLHRKTIKLKMLNFDIAQAYMTGLRYNGQWDVMPRILKKYAIFFSNHPLYLFNQCLYLMEKNMNCSKQYQSLMKFYKDRYDKTKEEKYLKEKRYLFIQWCIYTKEYTKALESLESIQVFDHLLENVELSYLKAVCLYHIDQREESKQLFEYVVCHGNTLHYVTLSKHYLEEMKNFS